MYEKGVCFFQFPCIKELGDDAFNFVFEGSELLAKLTEGLDSKSCKYYCNLELVTRDLGFDHAKVKHFLSY